MSRLDWTRTSRTSPIGVHRSPEIHLLSPDPDEHLVQVPAAVRLRPAGPQPTRNTGSERVDPTPDGFVGDLDAALCQEILDVAIAEGEAPLHPDDALDDVRHEAVAAK